LRHLYSLLIHVLRPAAFAVVLWRGLRNRRYWLGLGERFGWGPELRGIPAVWVHAVSLGEVTAAAPLVRALQVRHPHVAVVLTTATPTGRDRAHALFGDSVAVRYLPYDTPGGVRRFLARVRPLLAIIMETELWPNLFNECRRRGIPVVLANARLSSTSVRRYRRFGGLFRGVFSGNTRVAAQTADDAERFIAIGAERSRTCVIGNVKFDRAIDPGLIARGALLREACWGPRPVWIAGSTHAGEEELVLAAHAELQTAVASALLLLVPRHPERFESVAELLTRRNIRFERRSSGQSVHPDTQVVLVDTVGELAALYASVDVAFVGGSLVPVGGHNLLEPAALGIPVVTGLHQQNGRDIAELLVRAGAALQVADACELAESLQRLFADPPLRQRMGASGRRVVEANRGSVQRLLELIEALLASAPTAPYPAAGN
jgi:3-deoxy-D-manno-octulosonic-acid transferase